MKQLLFKKNECHENIQVMLSTFCLNFCLRSIDACLNLDQQQSVDTCLQTCHGVSTDTYKLVDTHLTFHQLSIECRSSVNRVSIKCWPSVDQDVGQLLIELLIGTQPQMYLADTCMIFSSLECSKVYFIGNNVVLRNPRLH